MGQCREPEPPADVGEALDALSEVEQEWIADDLGNGHLDVHDDAKPLLRTIRRALRQRIPDEIRALPESEPDWPERMRMAADQSSDSVLAAVVRGWAEEFEQARAIARAEGGEK